MAAQSEPLPNEPARLIELAAGSADLQDIPASSAGNVQPEAPSNTDAGNATREVAMPKFLQDDTEGKEIAERSVETHVGPLAAENMRAFDPNVHAPWVFSAATFGLAALFLAFQYANTGRTRSVEHVVELPRIDLPRVEPDISKVRLSFVSQQACERPPCDALSTSVVRTIATMPIEPAHAASPGIVYAASPAPIVEDRSALDPLDRVTVKGLPPEVRLSVGHKTSDTEWSLMAGDLANIDMTVPAGVENVHATIEIKKREGETVAVLGLTIWHEAPAAPLASLPAAVEKEVEESSSAPPEKEAEALANRPVKSLKPAKMAKAKVRQRAKSMQPLIQASPKPQTPILRGLLPLPSVAKAAPNPSTEKNPEAEAVEGKPAAYSTAASDQPPGFETLMNLGGGFGLQKP